MPNFDIMLHDVQMQLWNVRRLHPRDVTVSSCRYTC